MGVYPLVFHLLHKIVFIVLSAKEKFNTPFEITGQNPYFCQSKLC